MNASFPSTEEWRNLYAEAMELKKIECWNWMEDSDLFGVRNPENGEIGYCCVLGAQGDVFGLTVYLGEEGLNGYLKIQSGEIQPEDMDVIYIQNCLVASFDDRKFLEKEDLKVIRALRMKFRGPKAWPLFRRYQPGYQPWFLNREEALFLTVALQQTRGVALRFKEDRNLLTPPFHDHHLIRVPQREGTHLRWSDEWLGPSPSKDRLLEIPPVDELRLQRIKKRASKRPEIWESDLFYAPFVVHEGEKPFFPCIFLWVDHQSGLVLRHHLAKQEKCKEEYQNEFLTFIEKTKVYPKELIVKREEGLKLLEPIARKLEIKLTLANRLMALEEAREDMEHFFLSGEFR